MPTDIGCVVASSFCGRAMCRSDRRSRANCSCPHISEVRLPHRAGISLCPRRAKCTNSSITFFGRDSSQGTSDQACLHTW